MMTQNQPKTVNSRLRDNVQDTDRECVVPARCSSIEVGEVVQTATVLTRDQKEYIASKEYVKERTVSEAGAETSPSYISAPSPQTLVTPPPSSTLKCTTVTVDKHNLGSTATVTEQPVLQNKRVRRKPAPLDVDALRRERQYSGPYSANPILSQKRNHSQSSDKPQKGIEPSSRTENTIQIDGRAKEQDSLQMTPHSGPSSEQGQLPQIPQIIAAPFVSPALARDSFPLSPFCASGVRHFDGRASTRLNGTPKWSKELKTVDGDHYHRSLPSISDRIGKQDMLPESKRKRFIALCGEIWDLFDSR